MGAFGGGALRERRAPRRRPGAVHAQTHRRAHGAGHGRARQGLYCVHDGPRRGRSPRACADSTALQTVCCSPGLSTSKALPFRGRCAAKRSKCRLRDVPYPWCDTYDANVENPNGQGNNTCRVAEKEVKIRWPGIGSERFEVCFSPSISQRARALGWKRTGVVLCAGSSHVRRERKASSARRTVSGSPGKGRCDLFSFHGPRRRALRGIHAAQTLPRTGRTCSCAA
jgi:hypothetical protein